MNGDPKFWPIDALNAYPDPVGTLDKLELSGGAVWVHLNGKRAKLVGLQSLAFLIGNLQAIHEEVFASAEPSAPKCCEPTAEEEALLAAGDYQPEELWGGPRPTCPKCIKGKPSAPVERWKGLHRAMQLQRDHHRNTAESLRAQVAEQDALLREVVETPLAHSLPIRAKIVEALSASAATSAPVERDEREDFEAHIRRDFPGVVLTRKKHSGEYLNPSVEVYWLSWRDRAARERAAK